MEPIERIERATAVAEEKVADVTEADFSKPTPCSEFDVKELLRHMIGGLEMLRTAASGGKAVVPEGDIVGTEPGRRYSEGRDRLLEVLREPGVFDRTWEMPFGAMPGKMMAGIAFLEHLTHAWDIAKATGQDATLPDDLASECLELATPMDQMLRMPNVCAQKVDVAEDASPTDKLVAFLGRQP